MFSYKTIVLIIGISLLVGCTHSATKIKQQPINKITRIEVKPKPVVVKKPTSAKLEFWSPLIAYHVSSPFGWRGKSFHRGVDLAAPVGTKVRSVMEGTISSAGRINYLNGYGNAVLISHGNHVFTYYCHLDKVIVKKGQNVDRDYVIGTIGNTGRSRGAHLHFELIVKNKHYDPLQFIVNKPFHYKVLDFTKSIELGSGLKLLLKSLK